MASVPVISNCFKSLQVNSIAVSELLYPSRGGVGVYACGNLPSIADLAAEVSLNGHFDCLAFP
jgi:hypothetical protein